MVLLEFMAKKGLVYIVGHKMQGEIVLIFKLVLSSYGWGNIQNSVYGKIKISLI